MTKMFFASDRQDDHLKEGLRLTRSEGFLSDAVAIAAYSDEGSKRELRCVAVFEAVRGGRADLHFGLTDTSRLTPDIITAISTIAFHPRHMDLNRLMARIPADRPDVLAIAIKIGFRFEYVDRGALVDGADAVVMSLDRAVILSNTNAPPQAG